MPPLDENDDGDWGAAVKIEVNDSSESKIDASLSQVMS
jgi:hypothetical protein